MKPRNQFFFFMTVILLVLGAAFYTFSTRPPTPTQPFPATINRDCAPWDGAAFTVAVHHDSGTVIYISIWQPPDIQFPTTFQMPDDVKAEQDGNAYILPELGPYMPLHGEVSFQRVEVGIPIEGRFRFKSAKGEQFEGQFIAEWGDQVVYCG